MKKALVGFVVAMFMFTGLAFASVPVNKAHKGLTGLDKAKINCAYCHKTAQIPKKKGQDKVKLKTQAQCGGKGCH